MSVQEDRRVHRHCGKEFGTTTSPSCPSFTSSSPFPPTRCLLSRKNKGGSERTTQSTQSISSYLFFSLSRCSVNIGKWKRGGSESERRGDGGTQSGVEGEKKEGKKGNEKRYTRLPTPLLCIIIIMTSFFSALVFMTWSVEVSESRILLVYSSLNILHDCVSLRSTFPDREIGRYDDDGDYDGDDDDVDDRECRLHDVVFARLFRCGRWQAKTDKIHSTATW